MDFFKDRVREVAIEFRETKLEFRAKHLRRKVAQKSSFRDLFFDIRASARVEDLDSSDVFPFAVDAIFIIAGSTLGRESGARRRERLEEKEAVRFNRLEEF